MRDVYIWLLRNLWESQIWFQRIYFCHVVPPLKWIILAMKNLRTIESQSYSILSWFGHDNILAQWLLLFGDKIKWYPNSFSRRALSQERDNNHCFLRGLDVMWSVPHKVVGGVPHFKGCESVSCIEKHYLYIKQRDDSNGCIDDDYDDTDDDIRAYNRKQ